MTTLNSSTLRRLKKLKQAATVWEGDRRPLPKARSQQDGTNLIPLHQNVGDEEQPQCIIWVDGSMGMVRAMDIVEPEVGQEAFVRALLQAMERPQSPAQPGMPQKILLSDRSMQFYLRGVLQDLNISVEYVEQLPLIDEIFANIVQHANTSPPAVPEEQARPLYAQADILLHRSPWEYLWDHEVISVEINSRDLGTLYAVVMGRLGLEQGVIFYRTKDSLMQFRQRIAANDSDEDLEETFLHQDCLFVLFESTESLDESELNYMCAQGWPVAHDSVYPIFGMLHPLEGGRPFLYDEEAISLTVAIESFNQFLTQYGSKLKSGKSPALQGKYTIQVPTAAEHEATAGLAVTVKTMPELSEEIHSLAEEEYEDDEPQIHEDLWPDKALFQLLAMPWSGVKNLRTVVPHRYVAEATFPEKGDALSGLLIQTSRPKALDLIREIEKFGGIKGICFNPAESFLGESSEVGLVVMGNGDLHLFGEFHEDNPDLAQIRKKWQQRCKNAKGNCAVIIAMGVTGLSRGNPEINHILGYYEVKLISSKELGLGTLRSEPDFDFDFDF
jgi:hypothetical protein